LSAEPGFDFLLKTYDEACAKFDTGRVAKEKFFQDLEKWKGIADQARAEGKPVPRRPRNVDPHQDQHNPCVLYNGMIAPLVPYAVRGALWYQGESNYPTGKIYFDLMKTLIADWRSAWHQDDFPFLFVQLANNKKPAADPNEKSEMAPVREGQFKTLRLEDTGMAVAIDIGDADNIHPKNKQEIGRRLGLVARALVYGEQSVYSGPLFRKVKIKGHTVRVSFRHTEGGLTAKGDTLKGFAIAGPGGKFFWADAKIDGKVVVVSSPDVPEPVAVRYGWADNPTVNLYNGAGLPASPFRTDGW
jgi:sialate O-acetylesterase